MNYTISFESQKKQNPRNRIHFSTGKELEITQERRVESSFVCRDSHSNLPKGLIQQKYTEKRKQKER